MGASGPGEFEERWAKAFNGGDLDGLLALYEPGATLLPQPGRSQG
jgi:ketosteroid isomerase-like protein